MGDVNNHYEALDRSLKKLGIVLVDDLGLLRNGKASQCVDLLRKILLGTSVVVAKQLLQRGCPSHATDKKLVAAAFDLVRDKVKFLPSLTVDQFFKEGFAAHKLAILVKLVGYIAEIDKSFSKAQPAKVMYVVPTQVGLNSTLESADDEENSGPAEGEESAVDDSLQLSEEADRPPPPAARTKPADTSHEWPQTNFIKKHILDNNRLKNAKAASPSGKPGSNGRSTSAGRSGARSTTPSSVRKPRRDDSESLSGVDIYDVEEKTAALEAIQALRAARSQGNSRVGTALSAAHTPISTYNAEPPIFHNNNPLMELAAAEVMAAGSPHKLSSPVRAPQPGGVYFSDAAQQQQLSGLGQSGDLAALIQRAVDAAVLDKLQNDAEVQKVLEERVEALVQARVQQATQELSTKYDFIINKLVAAVDAEFTLLNNKLTMAQQAQHQSPPGTENY